MPNITYISEFKEACVHYISGFVVYKLEPKIKCFACAEALSSRDGASHSFIFMVDGGKLKKPSNSLSDICVEAENAFKGFSMPHKVTFLRDWVSRKLCHFPFYKTLVTGTISLS